MSQKFSLNVNGKDHTFEADPEMPLLWVLRDVLDLKGTKFGCGMTLCGACTIHIDGSPTRSCMFPVEAAAGKKIKTIEGMNHRLQEVWTEQSVPQCGYCQSGQLMSAIALLESNPTPNAQQIDDAMSGNICRCGTYPRIKKAIATVATENTK